MAKRKAVKRKVVKRKVAKKAVKKASVSAVESWKEECREFDRQRDKGRDQNLEPRKGGIQVDLNDIQQRKFEAIASLSQAISSLSRAIESNGVSLSIHDCQFDLTKDVQRSAIHVS